MNITGNTMLITGGNSGIGRALAEAFHARGNTVIIAGRRQETLNEVTATNPGMHAVQLDVEDAAAIRQVVAQLTHDFPGLNVLVNNAGIMRAEDLKALQDTLPDAEATIATNLLGPLRLTAALLPHFHAQAQADPEARAAILNVTSGLAFVPLSHTPTYSATKAALHSYSQALRSQLAGTSTQVIELIPPLVATDLMPGQAANPHAMPLSDYVSETLSLLQAQPEAAEIVVERVKFLRYAAESGHFAEVYGQLNG